MHFTNQPTQKDIIADKLSALQPIPFASRFLGCPHLIPLAHLVSEPPWGTVPAPLFWHWGGMLSLCCLPSCRWPLSQMQGQPGHTLRGTPQPLGIQGLMDKYSQLPSLQWHYSEVRSAQQLRGSHKCALVTPAVSAHQHTLHSLSLTLIRPKMSYVKILTLYPYFTDGKIKWRDKNPLVI